MSKLLKVISILFLTASVYAQSFTIMPYYMPINYSNSGVRENSSLTGIYTAWQMDLNHTVEFAVDYSNLQYFYDFQIDQYDFTFVYTNESIPEWRFRIGAHHISSDDELTDKSFVVFGGISTYRFRSWDASVNAYYSSYSDYEPSLYTIQLSPSFGLTYSFNRLHGLHLKSEANFILLSDSIQNSKKNFFSVKETLTYYNDRLSISAYALFGKQMFSVRQDGFLVYNVADIMKTGFGASITYSFSPSFFLKAGFEHDSFNENAYGTSATSNKFLILAGFNF